MTVIVDETNIEFTPGEGPLPRSGHCMVADAGNLYVIGGYVQHTHDLVVEPEIWRFNFLSGQWCQLEFKQSSYRLAASSAACVIGRDIIVHGGTGTPFGRLIDNSLIVLNLPSLESYILPMLLKDGIARNEPIPTYGHTITFVVVNGEPYLYKLGGVKSSQYTMNVYCYSLRAKTWDLVSHSNDSNDWRPEPRYKHDTVFFTNRLYVIGGRNVDVRPVLPIPVFDLQTHRWSRVQCTGTQPNPLSYQNSVLVKSYVYIFGGTFVSGLINRDLYCVDLELQTCTRIATLEAAAYFHSVVYVPQSREIYSFGGNVSTTPTIRTNRLTRFNLHMLCLRLSEVAWISVVSVMTANNFFLDVFRDLIVTVEQTAKELVSLDKVVMLRTISHLLNGIQFKIFGKRLFSSFMFSKRLPTRMFHMTNLKLFCASLKALAITLLALFSQQLGLRSCGNSVSVTNELCNVIRESKWNPDGWVECMQVLEEHYLSDTFHLDELPTLPVCVFHLLRTIPKHPPAVPITSARRAPLSLNGQWDELFLVALFYHISVPLEFIDRFPDGSLLCHFIDRLDFALHGVER